MAGNLRACNYDFNSSTDSQFTETEDDISFLEACMDCDEDALYDLIQEGVTRDCVNERDKSGRTGLSHACGNGFMPILELLCEVDECDVNLPDKEGNTPLIFAAQAGHADVVNFLLNRFRRVRVDQCSNAGFTPLMKASIQGRTRCAKLLLFQGANPNRRDYGRGLCAEEWARFCGRQACADAISKYVHSKKYFFKKTFMLSRERWSSEPDLMSAARSRRRGESGSGGSSGSGGNWITRHLSFKRKGRGGGGRGGSLRETCELTESGEMSPLSAEGRSNSSPLLTCTTPSPPASPVPNMRRPSCIDGVVNVNIKKLKSKGGAPFNIPIVEELSRKPPRILQTDFDAEAIGKVGGGGGAVGGKVSETTSGLASASGCAGPTPSPVAVVVSGSKSSGAAASSGSSLGRGAHASTSPPVSPTILEEEDDGLV